MRGIVALVASYADRIDDGRSQVDSFNYLAAEVNELADEVAGVMPGPDGIFGEAVDVMINCIDMMRSEYPNLTLAQLEAKVYEYTRTKCDKWEAKYGTARTA